MSFPYEQRPDEEMLLRGIEQRFAADGRTTALFDPAPPAENFSSLVVAHPVGATTMPTVHLEFSFIPLPAGEESPFVNLQTYAQLCDGLGPGAFDGLRWLTTKLNCFLPVGFFGVFDSLGVLFWKQTHLLDKTAAMDANLTLIERQTAMAITVLGDFTDTLLVAASGARPAAAALRANKWAPLLFPDQAE
ncbi:MAG: hypothetical protein ACYDAR_00145 [Thermomicrobiales bacterium]